MAWAPNYVEDEDLVAYVRIPDVLDDEDPVNGPESFTLAIAAASRAIDAFTGRQFGLEPSPVARYYSAAVDGPTGRLGVRIDDLMMTGGLLVEVDEDGSGQYATAVTDYVLTPRNAPADRGPWTGLVAAGLPTDPEAVRVTARFGWSAVPDPVRQACLLQASRFLSRRDSPYGVAGSPSDGSEVRLLAKVDPDVAVLLRPYKRRWWAA